MNLNNVAHRVSRGFEVTFRPRGQSMQPRIRSGQLVTVVPIKPEEVQKGDVVLAKVRGMWWLHLAAKIEGDRVQITNIRGHVNGWTHRKNVIGRVVE